MVDVQRVKKYNDALKNAKDNSNKIATEISYAKRELERLCTELSAELGETVTVDNVAEIYKRESEKIERTLSMGEEILARVITGSGEVAPSSVGVQNGVGVTPAANPVSAPVSAPVTENAMGGAGISGFDAFAGNNGNNQNGAGGVSGDFGSLFGNL